MADEISFLQQLSVQNGSLGGQQYAQGTPDQATIGAYPKTQTITTSDTVISLTGPTAARWVQIKNTDATNYISIGPTSSGAIVKMARLLPGESMQFPLEAGAVLRGQAHTASVTIEYLLLET